MRPDTTTQGIDIKVSERSVRWFVAGALAIVIAGMAAMAVQKGVFQRTTRLHCVVDSAKGMTPGMAVRLNGFRIGALDRLEMDADGRVGMVLAVGDEYVHLVRKDAKARWVKEGLLGESVIDIQPGSPDLPAVENGGVIAFERARDIGEELSRLAEQLQPILADVKKITAYLDDPEGDLKTGARELRRASTAFADAGEDVGEITRRSKKDVHSAIANASRTMNRLDAELPRLIGRLDTTLRNVESVSADAKAISSQLASDLPPAVGDGREAAQDARDVLKAVKGSWPVRDMLPPEKEHALPLDSHVPRDR